jgi:GT2 family glycosyltransferase
VVIPNHNGTAWIPGCLSGLEVQEFRDFEVVFVDNGSTDDSVSRARELRPDIRLTVFERNRGFASAVNAGTTAARGEYVALLNTDTVARPLWLAALVSALDEADEDVGAVAPKMLRMDDPDTVDDAGDALFWTGAAEKVGHGRPASEYNTPREIFAPSGGASLYRRTFLEEMGGFDERFFAYLEDVDIALRGRLRGFRFLFEPAAEILHKGHGSDIPPSSYVRLVTRNRVLLFAKSIPLALLLRNLGTLLYGQFYFFVVYRRPLSSLIGYASLVPQLPHILRERRKMRPRVQVEAGELQERLGGRMSEPPLGEVLLRAVRRLR